MINFVPKQETCQLLKEAGMPQGDLRRIKDICYVDKNGGGEFYWIHGSREPLHRSEFYNCRVKPEHVIACAPLTDELLRMFDAKSVSQKDFERINDRILFAIYSENIPESLAQLILELKKEGVVLW